MTLVFPFIWDAVIGWRFLDKISFWSHSPGSVSLLIPAIHSKLPSDGMDQIGEEMPDIGLNNTSKPVKPDISSG